MWLFVLERGTKAEFCGKSTAKRVVGSSKNLLNDVKVLSHKVSSKSGGATKKKGPMKADHTIGTVKASEVSHVMHVLASSSYMYLLCAAVYCSFAVA